MFAALQLLLLAAFQTFSLAHNLMSIQSPPSQGVVASANSRACAANPVLAGNSKSKPQKKSKHPLAPEPLPACLELKGEPLEVQEFLQSVGKPTDKFSGQPATMWPLNSRGILEQELIGALQTRFKHAA